MKTIQLLEDNLINKIAAGEVIENPASVVKELVENSIDAKATNIAVEVKNSGFQLIKVEDNGIGMNKEDAILCFERHATSKIKSISDLNNINSMGFRGEALASIAAISKIDLKTSQTDIATFIKVEASQIISIGEIARIKGTTIEVRSLFYNVPVRRKFQKSIACINSEIIKTLTNQVLAHPTIGFSLILNGKKIFFTHSSKKEIKIAFKKRIKEFLPKDISAGMEVDFKEKNIEIFGYIGLPEVCKKTKIMQYLVINNRSIKSFVLSKFIKDAYATRIAKDDFPVFALHIRVINNFIDVNVHPQKKEVRIAEMLYIEQSIKKAIDASFQKEAKNTKETICFNSNLHFSKTSFEISQNEEKENIFEKFDRQLLFENSYRNEVLIQDFLKIDHFLFIDATLLKNFIEINENDKICVIDISLIFTNYLFKKIKKKENISKRQNLLIPIHISLNRDEVVFIEDNLDQFNKLGFDIRIIALDQIAIDTIFETIKQEDVKDLFFIILEDMKLYNNTLQLKKEYDRKLLNKLHMIATRKNYTKQEAIKLLNFFIEYEKTNIDLLGRVVIIKFNKDQIYKLFKK